MSSKQHTLVSHAVALRGWAVQCDAGQSVPQSCPYAHRYVHFCLPRLATWAVCILLANALQGVHLHCRNMTQLSKQQLNNMQQRLQNAKSLQ